MWCARLPLSRPDSAVVVRVGRNWAAFGSPFFYLSCFTLRINFNNTEMLQNLRKRYETFTFTCQ